MTPPQAHARLDPDGTGRGVDVHPVHAARGDEDAAPCRAGQPVPGGLHPDRQVPSARVPHGGDHVPGPPGGHHEVGPLREPELETGDFLRVPGVGGAQDGDIGEIRESAHAADDARII
jgi:hypothetical protein